MSFLFNYKSTLNKLYEIKINVINLKLLAGFKDKLKIFFKKRKIPSFI